MATLLTDTFQFTDGNTLDSTTDWETHTIAGSGVMTSDLHTDHQTSGQVVDMSSTGHQYALHQTALADDDMTVELMFLADARTSGAAHGVILRGDAAVADGTLDGYEVEAASVDTDWTVYIHRWDNGSRTTLSTVTAANDKGNHDATYSTGDAERTGLSRLTGKIVGSTITAYFNGVEIASTTDSTHTTGLYAGFTQNRKVSASTSQPFVSSFAAWDSTETGKLWNDIIQCATEAVGYDGSNYGRKIVTDFETPTAGNLLLAFAFNNDITNIDSGAAQLLVDDGTGTWTLEGNAATASTVSELLVFSKTAAGDETYATFTDTSESNSGELNGQLTVVELPSSYTIDDIVVDADTELVTTATLSSDEKLVFFGGSLEKTYGWQSAVAVDRWLSRGMSTAVHATSPWALYCDDLGTATTAFSTDVHYSDGEITTFAAVVKKSGGGATSHPLTASGSTTTGGSAAIDATRPLAASGSTTTGGSVALNVTHPLSASGSTTTDGSAAIAIAAVTHSLSASGSATTDGSAAMNVAHPLAAAGSTTTTGSAAINASRPLSSSGSTTTTGSAAVNATRPLSSSGSTTTTGSASINIEGSGTDHPLTASGSTTTTGSATIGCTRPLSAAGSTTTTGSGTIAARRPLSAAGSSTTTGSATIGCTRPLSAAGSSTTSGSAAMVLTMPLSASGSVTTSGSATIEVPPKSLTLTAAGAASTSGAADINCVRPMSAAGAATTTGAASFSIAWTGSFVRLHNGQKARVRNADGSAASVRLFDGARL